MHKRILVFPGGMPRSLAYAEQACAEGRHLVGASSLGHDPARDNYDCWTHLPFVTAPDFEEALRAAITEFDIGGIYTPNAVIWNYLSSRIGESFPGVSLVNASPVENEVLPYQKALEFGQLLCKEPLSLASHTQPLPRAPALETAALFRHAETIPGMCDHEKIRALCEIIRFSPKGDVIEIGSWWGKSAFVFLRLLQSYGTGKLLCVDPWSNDCLVQDDEKGLVDQVPVNAGEALTVFQLNLLPYAKGDINYLRLPSIDAAEHYRAKREITTPVFGKTSYSGEIAVLHIDGNHSYEAVGADMEAWSDMVRPGGWIIVDDYIWPYGNGPQVIGDDFLEKRAESIGMAFVMGSALFIQLR